MGKDCIAQAQSGKGEVLTHVELCVPLAKARVKASGEQQCPLRLSQQLRRESIRQRSITVVSKKNRQRAAAEHFTAPQESHSPLNVCPSRPKLVWQT